MQMAAERERNLIQHETQEFKHLVCSFHPQTLQRLRSILLTERTLTFFKAKIHFRSLNQRSTTTGNPPYQIGGTGKFGSAVLRQLVSNLSQRPIPHFCSSFLWQQFMYIWSNIFDCHFTEMSSNFVSNFISEGMKFTRVKFDVPPSFLSQLFVSGNHSTKNGLLKCWNPHISYRKLGLRQTQLFHVISFSSWFHPRELNGFIDFD